MADTILGRFLWHELMTTEPQAALTFYPKVVGWKTQAWEQNADYKLWVAKSGPVGGMMQLPESTRSAGAKSHWLPYAGTPDIAATVSQATGLGALVLVPVSEIPNGGRYAVLADPQGAMFGLYAAPNAKPPGAPQLGEFSWHELAATDYQSAFAFYQQLFGWEKTAEHDMGPMGVYFMFGFGGVPMGGIFNKHADTAAHWLNYALVPDAAKAGKAATAGGGRVINGPMEVPGGDWITQILDPQGAAFAVHAHKKAAAVQSAPAPKSKPEPVAAASAEPAKKTAKKVSAPKKAKTAKKSTVRAKAKSVKAKRSTKAKKAAKKKVVRKPAAKKKFAKKASKKSARKSAKKKSAGKKKAARKK